VCVCVCARAGVLNFIFFLIWPSCDTLVLFFIITFFFKGTLMGTYGPLFSHFPMLDAREDSHPFHLSLDTKVGERKVLNN